MNQEPDYVIASDKEDPSSERIELPTESDNTLGLHTLTRAFPEAHGLKFKNPATNTYRALLYDSTSYKFLPPAGGWQNKIFIVIYKPSSSGSKSTDISCDPRQQKTYPYIWVDNVGVDYIEFEVPKPFVACAEILCHTLGRAPRLSETDKVGKVDGGRILRLEFKDISEMEYVLENLSQTIAKDIIGSRSPFREVDIDFCRMYLTDQEREKNGNDVDESKVEDLVQAQVNARIELLKTNPLGDRYTKDYY